MNYIAPDFYELAVARIVPAPKKAERLGNEPLFFSPAVRFEISAPRAEYGPVMTAGVRARALFGRLASASQAPGGEAFPVTLAIAPAPFAMTCADEGYQLTVDEGGVTVTGFGERGLLYGVITLEQLTQADTDGLRLPRIRVTDWPDCPIRGIKEECRWGSDMMEREDWLAMLDDMVGRKMNLLCIAFYGCWMVQYDMRVSEYVYLPVKGHPELQTPKLVKYWSPEEGRWIECEQLPPIYSGGFIEEIFRRARDLGIQVAPCWNSFGHNTLIPGKIPMVSAKEEDGTPTLNGFCTSEPATYELLFSIFDQLLDDYMLPYGMDTFHLSLDEVLAGSGTNVADIFKIRDPWCACPKCKGLTKAEVFLRHAVRLIEYLKGRGVKHVIIASDMLQPSRQRGLGMPDLAEKLIAVLREKGLFDALTLDWWSYHDHPDKNLIDSMHPEWGLDGFAAPWNGYYNWQLLLNPLPNAKILAEVNRRDGGKGLLAYSMWDRCSDRTHDAIAEYSWGLDEAGEVNDVTRRWALRHFPARAHEAFRALRFMDWCMEERYTSKFGTPEADHISNLDLLLYKLSSYFYVRPKADTPYPRSGLEEALQFVLTMRNDVERALYSISAMSKEAAAIFDELALAPDCDADMARRLAYECRVYQTLADDWMAILEIYDLTHSSDQKAIAPIARARRQARLNLMAECERAKEKFLARSLAMRIHSTYMQGFADIADYIERTDEPKLDLMQIRDVLSPRSWWLR